MPKIQWPKPKSQMMYQNNSALDLLQNHQKTKALRSPRPSPRAGAESKKFRVPRAAMDALPQRAEARRLPTASRPHQDAGPPRQAALRPHLIGSAPSRPARPSPCGLAAPTRIAVGRPAPGDDVTTAAAEGGGWRPRRAPRALVLARVKTPGLFMHGPKQLWKWNAPPRIGPGPGHDARVALRHLAFARLWRRVCPLASPGAGHLEVPPGRRRGDGAASTSRPRVDVKAESGTASLSPGLAQARPGHLEVPPGHGPRPVHYATVLACRAPPDLVVCHWPGQARLTDKSGV